MLDENLPTYRFKASSENPLHTLLFFSHNGSDPVPEYLLKRPSPSSAQDQYALGLLDAQNQSVIYAEVLLKPEWTQPTLSAAEVRAANGNAPQIPVTPDNFVVSLYNPDSSVTVKQNPASWGKSHAWEFEIPERTFKLPSTSRVDQDSGDTRVADLVPKTVFRWKRDGRLSKDMTCYLTGKSVGGKKSKEPDITVAFFHAKTDAAMTIYEPNMARVDVEDRKGLEMALIMSAERKRRRTNSRPSVSPPPSAAMSGALGIMGNARPASPLRTQKPSDQPAANVNSRRQAEIDAETKRLQAMVAEEERQARQRRDEEEAARTKRILDREEQERRKREAEVELETERLRKEYGVDGQSFAAPSPSHTSPQLPPRPQLRVPGTWFDGAQPQLPPRPKSVGPSTASPQMQPHFAPPPQQEPGGKKKHMLGSLLQGPYGGPAGASVSGFFGGKTEEEKRKKVEKERSLRF
ncbi:hypothetical protein G7046_g6022 [Stylonectria norvegica]|nr:hypothetical protein G7046_g6022 [Stylonectria norvegica]